jgi:hypothetical protein
MPYVVDIVCYTRGQSNNPFLAISRLYFNHTTARENKFLQSMGDPIESEDDSSKIEYELELILLPHQIILLPRIFTYNVKFGSASDITYIEEDDIR